MIEGRDMFVTNLQRLPSGETEITFTAPREPSPRWGAVIVLKHAAGQVVPNLGDHFQVTLKSVPS